MDSYTSDQITIAPVCFKNLSVSFNLDDIEKEYNRDSNLEFTFSEKLPAACISKISIKIPNLAENKTVADYFDIENNDEFLPLRIENNEGSFAAQVRYEYEQILINIRDKYFIKKTAGFQVLL